jgi:hypothetical protein
MSGSRGQVTGDRGQGTAVRFIFARYSLFPIPYSLSGGIR